MEICIQKITFTKHSFVNNENMFRLKIQTNFMYVTHNT